MSEEHDPRALEARFSVAELEPACAARARGRAQSSRAHAGRAGAAARRSAAAVIAGDGRVRAYARGARRAKSGWLKLSCSWRWASALCSLCGGLRTRLRLRARCRTSAASASAATAVGGAVAPFSRRPRDRHAPTAETARWSSPPSAARARACHAPRPWRSRSTQRAAAEPIPPPSSRCSSAPRRTRARRRRTRSRCSPSTSSALRTARSCKSAK